MSIAKWPDHDDEFSYTTPIFPTTITSADFPPTTVQFAYLDSGAGIGAGGGSYYIGTPTPVHYTIHGVNIKADFALSESQTCALMLTDDVSGIQFLGRYGGMLRVDPSIVSDLIFSTGQMSDLW